MHGMGGIFIYLMHDKIRVPALQGAVLPANRKVIGLRHRVDNMHRHIEVAENHLRYHQLWTALQ